MMSTGRPNNGRMLRQPAMPAFTWHFSAAMKFTGKRDGRTVPMDQTLLTVHWFVIKKVPSVKPYVVKNVILLLYGQGYGEMDVVTPVLVVVNLKMHYRDRSAGEMVQVLSRSLLLIRIFVSGDRRELPRLTMAR